MELSKLEKGLLGFIIVMGIIIALLIGKNIDQKEPVVISSQCPDGWICQGGRQANADYFFIKKRPRPEIELHTVAWREGGVPHNREYHMDYKYSEKLKVAIGTIQGVEFGYGDSGRYSISVYIGEIFDWDRDGIHQKIMSILKAGL